MSRGIASFFRAFAVASVRPGPRFTEFRSAIVASVILIFTMTIMCTWVSRRMEDGLLQREANEAVLLMDSIIKPLVQDLAQEPTLPRAARDALTAVLVEKNVGRAVAAIKIWSPSGTIVYSNRPELIDRAYPIFASLKHAFNGQVVVQFDDLNDDENEDERSLNLALLEIYAPMRESGTNRIIAVAEFYEKRDTLAAAVRENRLQTWAAFGSLTVAMVAISFGIAITQQRRGLERQVLELSRLLSENKELHRSIRDAYLRTSQINELLLCRVSAELHDGPAQLMGFVLLRLDALRPRQIDLRTIQHELPEVPGEFEAIRNAIAEAMNEIRNISAGLAPPDLADLSLARALEMAADRHAQRTRTTVSCEITGLPDFVDPSLKVCLYRFAQEGLNNAFRHADGHGQVLRAHCDDELLEVVVSDAGSASSGRRQLSGSEGLGLSGLRGRIESFGGVFEFQMLPGRGARLTARFILAKMEILHA